MQFNRHPSREALIRADFFEPPLCVFWRLSLQHPGAPSFFLLILHVPLHGLCRLCTGLDPSVEPQATGTGSQQLTWGSESQGSWCSLAPALRWAETIGGIFGLSEPPNRVSQATYPSVMRIPTPEPVQGPLNLSMVRVWLGLCSALNQGVECAQAWRHKDSSRREALGFQPGLEAFIMASCCSSIPSLSSLFWSSCAS